MALELRGIPVLEGKTAGRFINEAEANVKNPKKSHPRFLTLDEFERIELNRKSEKMQKEKMFTISECDRVIVTSKNLSDSFLFFVLKYCQNIHIHIGRSYTISQKTLL